MPKNTMGEFIAILRKAAGMTQRDLADKLNVSDKTVSRWERDETAPDISLLPIIADLFQINCDELLRGERITQEQRTENAERVQQRSEESIRRLLNRSRTTLLTQIFITLGIAFLGVVAAMAINYAAHNAPFAFFIGLIAFVAAIILQISFLLRAFAANPEDAAFPAVADFRLTAAKTTYFAVSAVLILFASTLPLLLMTKHGFVAGIAASDWFSQGLLTAAIMFAICYALYPLIMKVLAYFKLVKRLPKSPALPRKTRLFLVLYVVIALLTTYIGGFYQNKHRYYTPVLGTYTRTDEITEFKQLVENNYYNPDLQRHESYFDYQISVHTDGKQVVSNYVDQTFDGNTVTTSVWNLSDDHIQEDTANLGETPYTHTSTISFADGTTTELQFTVKNSQISKIEINEQPQAGKPFVTVYGLHTQTAFHINFVTLFTIEILAGIGIYHYLKKRQNKAEVPA